MATADGVVRLRERQNGYGNVVFIDHHGGKYTTVYGHLSRFDRNIRPGSRVRQGDVIGYVGSTGLSTAPHLHYEVRRGEEYLDPMKVALPQRTTLTARERNYFYRSTAALRRILLNDRSTGQVASLRQ